METKGPPSKEIRWKQVDSEYFLDMLRGIQELAKRASSQYPQLSQASKINKSYTEFRKDLDKIIYHCGKLIGKVK